jgi:hypothetical protein
MAQLKILSHLLLGRSRSMKKYIEEKEGKGRERNIIETKGQGKGSG